MCIFSSKKLLISGWPAIVSSVLSMYWYRTIVSLTGPASTSKLKSDSRFSYPSGRPARRCLAGIADLSSSAVPFAAVVPVLSATKCKVAGVCLIGLCRLFPYPSAPLARVFYAIFGLHRLVSVGSW